MSAEIMSLEKVQELARRVSAFDSAGGVQLGKGLVLGLCATVEHWHTRAADNLEANAQCAIAKHAVESRLQEAEIERDHLRSEVEHWHREAEDAARVAAVQAEELDAAVEIEAENDRLRALVGRMREALAHSGTILEALAASVDWELARTILDEIKATLVAQVRPVLADPDDQRAAEEYRKLRKDAEIWRSYVAHGQKVLRETETPEVQAEIAARIKAKEEAEEELRLLRAYEKSVLASIAAKTPEEHEAAMELEGESWDAIEAFRARQKSGSVLDGGER